MKDNFARLPLWRSDTMASVDALRESRKQLVLAADADRRAFERDVHDGIHQHLVALAVGLQLLGQALESDPAAAAKLVQELSDDVRQGLGETTRVAQRIYPAALGTGGLAALLRSAAGDAGVGASVEVAAGTDWPAHVEMTVYLAWLAALDGAGGVAPAAISVRQSDDAVVFDIDANGPGAELDRVQRRVEALGGRLDTLPGRNGRIRASGSLPLV
jgi:signal transduction histidine kinase